MKTFQLEGKSREVAATSADQKRALKAMRKNNEIPAVLYGGEKVSHFTITKEFSLSKTCRTARSDVRP